MAGQPPFNDLTLYTATTPNGPKPGVVLEELGLPYKCDTMDMFSPMIKEPCYSAINPNGRVPALKDGEMREFESGAIMLYLADHYDPEGKVSYKRDMVECYEMLSWLMFQMAGVGPMQGTVWRSTLENGEGKKLWLSGASTGQANHFRVLARVYSAYGQKRYMDETR
jgi:glutathione S-transferase